MPKERKKPGGIALRPALWKRIEAVAKQKGISKNEAMEQYLEAVVPVLPDFRISEVRSNNPEGLLSDDDFNPI